MAEIPDLDHNQNQINWSLHEKPFVHQITAKFREFYCIL